VITGEVGAGKTVAVRAALTGLDRSRHAVIYLPDPTVGVRGIHHRIVASLGGQPLTHHATLNIPIGVMIELPRAALIADYLAQGADFFSFGTNDLTQTTWGMSRDDAEGAFLARYRETGLLNVDPFTTLDDVGVGRLMRIAVAEGRRVRPDLGLGVCGEHAGDPVSIRRLAAIGVDYVSCSPLRVPIARLEAGRSAVLTEEHAAQESTGVPDAH